MVKDIIHDPFFLSLISETATEDDIFVADDLIETLNANSSSCVGMAANMIGVRKRILVFYENGIICEMFNPEIIMTKDKYTAEEGCLSLNGLRTAIRYKTVKVKWLNRKFQIRIKNFTGFTAQIIQHEIDHMNGILI